jgi:MraZ protein
VKNGKLWILVGKSGRLDNMKLFLGEYAHNVDDRGRVMLPRKIRSEIEDSEIILAKGFEPCIFGYEKDAWEHESQKHLETPVTDREGRRVRRYMFAGAQKAEIDKLGRILLPAQLKEYASCKDEVMILGAGDHFEIWDMETWRTYEKGLESV